MNRGLHTAGVGDKFNISVQECGDRVWNLMYREANDPKATRRNGGLVEINCP